MNRQTVALVALVAVAGIAGFWFFVLRKPGSVTAAPGQGTTPTPALPAGGAPLATPTPAVLPDPALPAAVVT